MRVASRAQRASAERSLTAADALSGVNVARVEIRGDDEFGCFGLDADGYYAFMYPALVQLESRTGQMIDPYRDAHFEAGSLLELRATLVQVRSELVLQPPDFDVVTAWKNAKRKVPARVDRVHRDDFTWWLDRFLALVDRAVRLGRRIDCIGD